MQKISTMSDNCQQKDSGPASYVKLRTRLKELKGRSNDMGYDKRKSALHLFYVNG